MDVRAVLADVGSLGPFFAVSTDPTEQVDPTWRPLTHLYTDPATLRERIAHVRRVLGSDERIAASIAFQGLAARVLSVPFAAAVLHGVLPRLTADVLHFRVSVTGPWPLWCAVPPAAAVPDVSAAADALAGLLFDDHLAPLVAAVRTQVSISERLLWGSVASSVASGKRLVGMERPAAAARAAEIAGRLLAAGPLVGTGDLLDAAVPDVAWTFRRRSCCLYYRLRDGGLCGDCVLLNRRQPA